jgi:hypothetical protein
MGCEYDHEYWVRENLRENDVAFFKFKANICQGDWEKAKRPDSFAGNAAKIRSGYGTFRTELLYTKVLGK